eukprot:1145201-Pelagomonas_calceolata.AAC.3
MSILSAAEQNCVQESNCGACHTLITLENVSSSSWQPSPVCQRSGKAYCSCNLLSVTCKWLKGVQAAVLTRGLLPLACGLRVAERRASGRMDWRPVASVTFDLKAGGRCGWRPVASVTYDLWHVAYRWLKEELQAAEQAGERIIVSSHHPLGLGSARRTHMDRHHRTRKCVPHEMYAWNFEEVQATLCGSKACVLALAGHDHLGGYARIGHMHFVTQPAMLEAPEGGNAFGVIKVFSDRIEIDGLGSQVPSRTLHL